MLRNANTLVPSLVVGALLFGLSAPAFADVPPGPRERKTRTVEGHHAPEMTPPAEQPTPPEPEPAPQPEVATAPAPEAAPPPAQPEAKQDAKAATDSKSSSCSIDADSDRALGGIAALVMLIAGAGLLRRRS